MFCISVVQNPLFTSLQISDEPKIISVATERCRHIFCIFASVRGRIFLSQAKKTYTHKSR